MEDCTTMTQAEKTDKLTRAQLMTVVTMMTGTFLIILNQTLLSPVLPVLMTDFSIDATTVQWLTSGYSLVMAVVIPLSPYLLGRFGSRKLFLASMASFVVGSLVASIAPAFPVILIGRVFQAVAAGLVMPMSFTIVLLEFPRERRGSAMGIVMLVVGFAPAIGPTLSGILVDTVGWRMLFVIVALCALLVLLVGTKSLGQGPKFEATTFDKVSVVLSTIGLVALLYGLSSFTKSNNLLLVAALIVGGLILLAVFSVRQLRLKVPLLRITVLKTGRYRASVLVNMLNVAVSTGMSVMLPLFIQNLLGQTPFVTGLTMLPGAVAGALVGLMAGKLFDRRGIRICVVPGSCLMLVALVAMAVCFNGQTSLLVVGLAYGCMFIGMQLLNTTVGTWGLNALGNDVIQHAQAVGNTLNQIAGSLVTAVVISITALGAATAPSNNPLAGYEAGYHLGFIALLVVVFINFAIVMFFVRNAKKGAAAQTSDAVPAVHPGFGNQSVGSVMNQDPYCVAAGSSLREVATLFIERKVSGIPVIDGQRQVVGFVSDGDLMRYLASEDTTLFDTSLMVYRFNDPQNLEQRAAALLALTVDDIMTKEVVTVDQGLPLGQACAVLADKRIKKVPVIDGHQVLVGTLSRSDVVRSTLSGLVGQTS